MKRAAEMREKKLLNSSRIIKSYRNYYRISYTKKNTCSKNTTLFRLYRKSYSNFNDFRCFFYASRLHVSCCKIKTNKSFSKNFDPGERYDVPLSIAGTHTLWKWTPALGTRETWAWCKYSILLASKTSVQVHLHVCMS